MTDDEIAALMLRTLKTPFGPKQFAPRFVKAIGAPKLPTAADVRAFFAGVMDVQRQRVRRPQA